MTYKLIWKGEVIEDEISEIEEARYLQGEYNMAFNGGVVVRRER